MRLGWASLLLMLLAVGPVEGRGGGPLPGLTAAELLEFKRGFLAFRDQLFPQQGLGPAFNEARCYACHRNPALGGQSNKTVVRFGRMAGDRFDPLDAFGGPLLQANGIAAGCVERMPREASVVTMRNATSLLGAGLIEAIPDQQIIARAAEQAQDPARAGRVHLVASQSQGTRRVGRFGWKSQGAVLLDVVAEAMRNEMGFTNALVPAETPPGGDAALLAGCDAVADPEDRADFLGTVTRLVRYLAPPPGPSRVTETMLLGEAVFQEIGCAFCHATGYTAVSPYPAIDGQRVDLYSDLLLHDVGTGDGIVEGDARGTEFRTPPLWLVRGSHPYLHDGRARTVTEAIAAHGGQAQEVRDAYFARSSAEQNAVLKFLRR